MLSDSYVPRWVTIELAGGGAVHGIAFVVNKQSNRYAAELTDESVAEAIASAKGAVGTSADYLSQTMAHLQELGIRDIDLERVRQLTSRCR